MILILIALFLVLGFTTIACRIMLTIIKYNENLWCCYRGLELFYWCVNTAFWILGLCLLYLSC